MQRKIFSRLKKNVKTRTRRFLKDPVCCLGFFAVAFLGLIAIFGLRFSLESLIPWDFSFLTANVAAKFSSQSLFVEPIKNTSKESLAMAFIQENTLKGVAAPVAITPQVLGVLTEGTEDQEKAIVEYTVEPGDDLSSIAEKFNISLNTLLWANDLTKKSVVKTGKILVIPPVSGIIYSVKKGDTLSNVAKNYKGKVEEIIAFNELSGEGDIFVGDILVIPDGVMPPPPKKPKQYAAEIPVGSSYFICPHSPCKITQGLHWKNAVDVAGQCGDPIYAAAGGTVQKVKYGWNSGAGNYLSILHPNGVVTIYGHLTSSLVNPGQQVSQGQMIALVGGKPGAPGAGISTGCHIHFRLEGARNPLAR